MLEDVAVEHPHSARLVLHDEAHGVDPAWIARRMHPKITRAKAAAALSTLLALGLLARDDDGGVKQGEPLVSTRLET
jgi:hypothetical protein